MSAACYRRITPFRLAPGVELPDEPERLARRLADLGELLDLHEATLAAHRAGDADALLAADAPLTTSSGRGRLRLVEREALATRLSVYFGSTRFTRYEDVVPPVAAVSADGTLGWVGCEIEGEGTSTADGKSTPVSVGWSWIELYARAGAAVGGSGAAAPWRAIGNASSERP